MDGGRVLRIDAIAQLEDAGEGLINVMEEAGPIAAMAGGFAATSALLLDAPDELAKAFEGKSNDVLAEPAGEAGFAFGEHLVESRQFGETLLSFFDEHELDMGVAKAREAFEEPLKAVLNFGQLFIPPKGVEERDQGQHTADFDAEFMDGILREIVLASFESLTMPAPLLAERLVKVRVECFSAFRGDVVGIGRSFHRG